MATTRDITRYRWPPALVLRSMGPLIAAVGTCWLVLVAYLAAGGGGIWSAAAAAATAVVLGVAVWLLRHPPLVLEMSTTGYRLHHLRGGGVLRADWREVESADTRPTTDGPALVISLNGGRCSVVPLALLGSRANEAARELHERLNAGHGYRPLPG